MSVSLDTALQHHAIARRQLAAARKDLAAAERAGEDGIAPSDAHPILQRIDAVQRRLDEAEADLARAPVRNVWGFLVKVEALAGETMSAEAAGALRRDANALLDAQASRAA